MKVRGDWRSLYRAVDRDGQTIDFMLSEHRDEAPAPQFLAKAVSVNGLPRACAIDDGIQVVQISNGNIGRY